VDWINCLCESAKCFGVDTLLLGDIGLFCTTDGPASSWNGFHGSVSCSLCLRAYVALYFPPVGSYGFHSFGGGGTGGGSLGGGAPPIGLSGSGSCLGSGSSGVVVVGSMYNSIEEGSRLCPWLQSRGERAYCSREGGQGGLGRGRGRGSDHGSWGSNRDCIGDRGGTTSGAWGCDSCGKADGKMMAWLLISGAGVIDRAWPDDEEGGKNDSKEECDLPHALFCLMAALAFSVARSMTL